MVTINNQWCPFASPGDVDAAFFALVEDVGAGDCIVTLHAAHFNRSPAVGIAFTLQVTAPDLTKESTGYVLIGDNFEPGDPVTVTTGSDGTATQTIAPSSELPQGRRYLCTLSTPTATKPKSGVFAMFYILATPGEHDLRDLIDPQQ